MKVLIIIITLWCVSFMLILRKRGITLYIPNKKTQGTITKIIVTHRISKEPQRGKNSMQRQMDIVENFAEVEYYDGSRLIIAKSMFPVSNSKVGDKVVVRYRTGHNGRVWISEINSM